MSGIVIEKYTKFSMQLGYSKRPIFEPKDY